jgi:nucleoside-diphosphate-sugar epimerase
MPVVVTGGVGFLGSHHQPLLIDDLTRRKPDIILAAERLGWRPVVDTVDGLTQTVAFFKSPTRRYARWRTAASVSTSRRANPEIAVL